MAQDRFLIAPLEIGLETDVRPWLLPDTAFAELRNAYIEHGRIKKRFGSFFLNTAVDPDLQPSRSRLRLQIDTSAAGTGNVSVTVPGSYFAAGQQFSIGTTFFTVPTTGTPVTLLTTGAATGTYNTTTGLLTITGNGENPSTAVYFYPAQPVMGFVNYEVLNLSNEPLYAFDQQFSYEYDGTGWELLGPLSDLTAGTKPGLWTGLDHEFFWSENYRGPSTANRYIFTTNYKSADRIRYYDGTSWTKFTGTMARYQNGSTDEILTARLILSFKSRLVLFNTIEEVTAVATTYPGRARWSQVGDPVQAGAWYDNVGGKGSFKDAPTKQAIVSARIFKDRLIVYFERSTYELVYTGNEEDPFIFQEINSELGVESTFSTVPFDRSILGIGSTGIHGCNGGYVERIDMRIPDEIFMIRNANNGPQRVHGIRDYFSQIVYWAIPTNTQTTDFPTQVLVYNYENNTWAQNDDSITAFGYYQRSGGITWADETRTWQEVSDIWASGILQSQFRNVVAGNQQGFTFICDPENKTSRNAPSLQISQMSSSTLTVIDHNLAAGDYIVIENAEGSTNLNDTMVSVASITDSDTIEIDDSATGTYTGKGTIARVSIIDIRTKQYNFYVGNASNVEVPSISFFVDRTASGKIAVDILTSTSGLPDETQDLETYPFSTLYPNEANQDQLWHTIYPSGGNGNFVQLRLYLSTDQLESDTGRAIAWSAFQLHAMLFIAQKTSDRLQP